MTLCLGCEDLGGWLDDVADLINAAPEDAEPEMFLGPVQTTVPLPDGTERVTEYLRLVLVTRDDRLYYCQLPLGAYVRDQLSYVAVDTDNWWRRGQVSDVFGFIYDLLRKYNFDFTPWLVHLPITEPPLLATAPEYLYWHEALQVWGQRGVPPAQDHLLTTRRQPRAPDTWERAILDEEEP